MLFIGIICAFVVLNVFIVVYNCFLLCGCILGLFLLFEHFNYLV